MKCVCDCMYYHRLQKKVRMKLERVRQFHGAVCPEGALHAGERLIELRYRAIPPHPYRTFETNAVYIVRLDGHPVYHTKTTVQWISIGASRLSLK